MPLDLGKQFEQKVAQDLRQIPGVDAVRLPDQLTGRKNSKNLSDFIVYRYPSVYYLECKSIHGNTFNINSFTQYERLLGKSGIRGIHPCVIIWFVDHDRVIFFPIESVKKMKDEGLKSIHINTYNQYEHIDIPSKKKRVFMDSNYIPMFEYCKELDEKEVND